jgi:hypothetical protein
MTPLCPGTKRFQRLWLPLKGISIKKNYIGKLYYSIAITITKNMGYLRIGNFKVEYLHDFEFIGKKTVYPGPIGEVV